MSKNREYNLNTHELIETKNSYSIWWDRVEKKVNQNRKIIIIKGLLAKLYWYTKNLPTIKYIILMSLISVLISLVMLPLQLLIPAPNNFHVIVPDWSNYLNIFLQVVLLGPFLETITHQFFILTILKHVKWIKEYKGLHIFISALFFSIGHYNWGGIGKVIMTFFCGVIYAYSFILYSNKKNKPIIIVFIIHAMHNFIVTFIFSMVIKLVYTLMQGI